MSPINLEILVVIAYVIVAVALALMLLFSAQVKLRRQEPTTTGLTGIGVKLSWFLPLSVLEIAAAAGLLIGIAWRPLGIAAAIGVVLYFIGALTTHVRAKDFKHMQPPALLLILGIVAAWLGFAMV
jgi:hypothetical protein